jgi:AraC-like DNA-binding protein
MAADCFFKSRKDRTAAAWRRSTERAIDYMKAHLEEPQRLEDLAGVAATSPYHFSRLFRQVTGVSPTKFLCAIRLSSAVRLLLTTTCSVTDVCFDVGYSSLGTFVRRFTTLVGRPPCQLRRAAAAFDPAELRWLAELPAEDSLNLRPNGAVVSIEAPTDFAGLIFVAISREPMLDARLVESVVRPRPCQIAVEPISGDGIGYVFAVGLPWKNSPHEFLLNENILRARSAAIRIAPGSPPARMTLTLHAPETAEIPIVAPIALMLSKLARVHQLPMQASLSIDLGNDPHHVLAQA